MTLRIDSGTLAAKMSIVEIIRGIQNKKAAEEAIAQANAKQEAIKRENLFSEKEKQREERETKNKLQIQSILIKSNLAGMLQDLENYVTKTKYQNHTTLIHYEDENSKCFITLAWDYKFLETIDGIKSPAGYNYNSVGIEVDLNGAILIEGSRKYDGVRTMVSSSQWTQDPKTLENALAGAFLNPERHEPPGPIDQYTGGYGFS